MAVLVNKASLTASLGDKPSPDAMDKQVKEIEQLVSTAAGLRKDRGDTVKIAVVDFAADAGRDLAPVEPPSLLETLARQAGSFVSSGAIVLVALLLLWFGLRPATRMLLAAPAEFGPGVRRRLERAAAADVGARRPGDLAARRSRSAASAGRSRTSSSTPTTSATTSSRNSWRARTRARSAISRSWSISTRRSRRRFSSNGSVRERTHEAGSDHAVPRPLRSGRPGGRSVRRPGAGADAVQAAHAARRVRTPLRALRSL